MMMPSMEIYLHDLVMLELCKGEVQVPMPGGGQRSATTFDEYVTAMEDNKQKPYGGSIQIQIFSILEETAVYVWTRRADGLYKCTESHGRHYQKAQHVYYNKKDHYDTFEPETPVEALSQYKPQTLFSPVFDEVKLYSGLEAAVDMPIVSIMLARRRRA
eukprot:SAG31_NODE_2905_length_4925_cov_85.303357_5_plen_159_part_00